jgi:hypothetical protein
MGGLQVQCQPGQFSKTPSQNKKDLGVVMHTYNASYLGGEDRIMG